MMNASILLYFILWYERCRFFFFLLYLISCILLFCPFFFLSHDSPSFTHSLLI
ncbi:hypothetical protein BCR42DRAFT_409400 [Absidia repens]|uniref:Uncharacterized protein n=1 Tax=Absidia repens TaxID=90262 RepID=A0A1X2IR26_9FUNG|nr:hypothetical protein BCR42DRAFT_409400 [Absidia repens]